MHFSIWSHAALDISLYHSNRLSPNFTYTTVVFRKEILTLTKCLTYSSVYSIFSIISIGTRCKDAEALRQIWSSEVQLTSFHKWKLTAEHCQFFRATQFNVSLFILKLIRGWHFILLLIVFMLVLSRRWHMIVWVYNYSCLNTFHFNWIRVIEHEHGEGSKLRESLAKKLWHSPVNDVNKSNSSPTKCGPP